MQLAAGLAGAALGSLVGMPQIGWMIGSAVGGALAQPDQHGPKLPDLRVQVASYGAGVAKVWGTTALAGNVIRANNKVPHESEESAKGGPSIVTTSYTCTFAVLLCEGRPGVTYRARRIWANSRLAYDISDGASAEAKAASSDFEQYFTLYPGSEEQLPDPTLESFLGVGNTPAYRGSCYIVFTDLPLELDGNNIPSYTVELTQAEPEVDGVEHIAPMALNQWALTDEGESQPPIHSLGPTRYNYDGVDYENLADARAAMEAEYPWATEYIGFYSSVNALLSPFEGGAETDLNDSDGARYVYLAYHAEQPTVVINDGVNAGIGDPEFCAPLPCVTSGKSEPTMASSWGSTGGHYGIGRMFYRSGAGAPDELFYPYAGGGNCVLCAASPAGYFPIASVIQHRFIRAERMLAPPPPRCSPGDPCTLGAGIAELPGNPDFCITCDGEVSPNIVYTVETGTFAQLRALEQNLTEVTAWPLGPVLRDTDPLYDDEAFWTAQAMALGVSGTYGVDFPVAVTQAGVGASIGQSVAVSSIPLDELVIQACEECGYDASEIDFVGDFTAVVPGYLRMGGSMRGRDVIEALRPVYWFDSAGIDSKLVFVKRGGASVVTIGPDELGASESDEAKVLLVPTRAQETDLPAEFTVNYLSRARDYEPASQPARRQVTTSRQKQSVSPALVLDDQTAADAANVVLYDLWTGRVTVAWSTTRKYCHLTPTDVVTLDDGVSTYKVRITEASEEGPVIHWKGAIEEPSNYAPQAAAAILQASQSSIHFVGPMKLALLDLPLLRQADDGNAGPYAAATGYLTRWSGGVAYRSADGSSYSAVQDMTRKATLGYAQSVLPDFLGGNTIDEMSRVTVRVHGATTLSTVTLDELLAGGNACVIGANGRWEVLNFRRATLVGERTYLLTGLLRGRLGTEQHMGAHAADDLFVLLDPARLYGLADPVGVVDVPQVWKGVSFGTSVADASEIDFTNTGERLMPLAPVHLRATPIPGGGYAAAWVRRTRYEGAWLDYVDAPLGETTEAYLVEVLDGATVVETQTVTTPAATLASVDYSGHTLRVSQLSSRVGAGHPATLEIA